MTNVFSARQTKTKTKRIRPIHFLNKVDNEQMYIK